MVQVYEHTVHRGRCTNYEALRTMIYDMIQVHSSAFELYIRSACSD